MGEQSLADATACGAESARRGFAVEALRTAVRRENILSTGMRQLLPSKLDGKPRGAQRKRESERARSKYKDGEGGERRSHSQ